MTIATEHAIATPPVSPSTSLSVARPSLAYAMDPGKALRLAPTLQPDVGLLTTEGLITFGVKGSGKSNLLALLVEQLSRYFLPQVILDTEREYQSLVPLLPHGVLATASRCPSGADILAHGLQVVVDLQSWESDDQAARAMCRLIGELFTETNMIAPKDRVPCIIHLDEAAYWLPQEAVTYLAKDTRKALAEAFHKLARRGRKQGLTPFLYTQSISEVSKSAIRQAGIKVLMRQTLDIDLTRYCQYLQGATPRTRKAIQAYPSGKAIVILPDGSQHRVQFYERQSEHVSHTPQAQAALVKFAGMYFDASALPMRDLTVPTHKAQPARAHVSTTEAADNEQSAPPPLLLDRVQEMLAVNPTLRVVDLMKLVGCGKTTATKARQAYFAAHPERVPQRRTTTQQLYDLLIANPTLRVTALARLVGCSERLAGNVRHAYFAGRQEQHVPRPAPMREQIDTLLAVHPTFHVSELVKQVGCDRKTALRARQAYFAAHPEQRVPLPPIAHPDPVSKQVYAALDQDPTLRGVALMQAAGCSKATATKARKAYFEQPPEGLSV